MADDNQDELECKVLTMWATVSGYADGIFRHYVREALRLSEFYCRNLVLTDGWLWETDPKTQKIGEEIPVVKLEWTQDLYGRPGTVTIERLEDNYWCHFIMFVDLLCGLTVSKKLDMGFTVSDGKASKD